MKFVVCLVVAMPLLAQYPGQYPPGQSGQYPPGTMGGGGISLPSWAHKKKKKDDAAKTVPDFTADGRTVSNDGKKLVVDTSDGRTLNIALGDKTKFTQNGSTIAAKQIGPGTTIHVEASEDEESNLTAMTVQLVKAAVVEDRPSLAEKPAAEKPAADKARTTKPVSQTVASAQTSTPANSDDDDQPRRPALGSEPLDPNRPVLHRGKPKDVASDEDEGASSSRRVQTASTSKPSYSQAVPPAAKEPGDFTIDDHTTEQRKAAPKGGAQDLIQRAIEWSQTFTQGLPNYVCEQNTTRYMQQSKAEGWQALDLVTAKVIFEDGKEQYKEITVGGHKTNKSMLELGGSTSVGEFGSTLHSLFSMYSDAQFKFAESTSIGETAASIYDFTVALNHSDWVIQVGGQQLKPSYSGSIWIDKKTAQVRRIEMSANKIPTDFPLDHVEWTVDYDVVPLGTAKFLLPTHAENLSCQRGSNICVKNTTDFRNYHRYTGESTVTFQ